MARKLKTRFLHGRRFAKVMCTWMLAALVPLPPSLDQSCRALLTHLMKQDCATTMPTTYALRPEA